MQRETVVAVVILPEGSWKNLSSKRKTFAVFSVGGALGVFPSQSHVCTEGVGPDASVEYTPRRYRAV